MELDSTSPAHVPVPHDRACTNCARAKVKCVANHEVGAKCARCLRLKKDCQPSLAVRKRRTVKKSTATKTAQLEEKLDGLVTLLKSATQSTPIVTDSTNLSATSNHVHQSITSFESLTHSQNDENQSALHEIDGPRPSEGPLIGSHLHSPTTTLATSYEGSPCHGFEPTWKEAHDCFQRFRDDMLKHFPFLILPASTTAQGLRLERPFLWLCIMAISSKSSKQQMALGMEIRLALGRKLLLEGERSLDLLLGILTYAAWCHFHFQHKPILNNLVQLAMALVYDMGLNKEPFKESERVVFDCDARGCPKPFISSPRTMEQRRSAIGCYLVSAVISAYFRKIDTLRWTPYLEECLQIIGQNREHPTDILLAQLVRLQFVVEEAARVPWNDGPVSAAGAVKTPCAFYLKALQAQIQDFKRKIPADLQQNEFLLLTMYHAELSIHEIALSKASMVSNGLEFQRLESLYACLHATKSWFDLFLTFSPAVYINLPYAIFAQMAHCLIVLYRLSIFEHPGWDLRIVRDTLSFTLVIDKVITIMAQVKPAASLDPDSLAERIDTFSQNSRRLNAIKASWESRTAMDSTAPDAATATAMDENQGDISMDFLDDAWLKDVLGPWDLQF